MAFYIFQTTNSQHPVIYPNYFVQDYLTNGLFPQFMQLNPYYQNGNNNMNENFSMTTF